MADDSSEEKSFQASEKKLRDARRKGKVSSSKDLISGFAFLAIMIYLFTTWPTIRDRLVQLIDLTATAITQPFETASIEVLSRTMEIIWITIAPALGILILVILLTGMVGTMGPVLSFESIKPNFEHINPASGLKRLFSMRNVMEFAKAVFKVTFLGSVLFLVLRYWLQAMFYAPSCGEACIGPLLLAAAKPIIGTAALVFIIVGVLDTGIQRWLFRRDMKMTRSEMKRERKDMQGDPMILQQRRRDHQQQSRGPRLGLKVANFVIAGPDHIAGLRYHRKEVPLPVIVIRSSGKAASAILDAARELDIPVVGDDALARDLVAQHRPGDYVHERHFPAIARILIDQGLVTSQR